MSSLDPPLSSPKLHYFGYGGKEEVSAFFWGGGGGGEEAAASSPRAE